MKILAIIPARGGSKGVPNKNNKLLGRKPLIGFSIECALKSGLFDEIVVSSDDESTLKLVDQVTGVIGLKRPEHLATDESPTIDTVIQVVDYYKQQNRTFDTVCLLQPTVPFRGTTEIKFAVNRFVESKADSLISVREVPSKYNPHWTFLQQDQSPFIELSIGSSDIIKRRQELPVAYYRDGSIYLVKVSILETMHSLYGKKISYLLNKSECYINIDTKDDWRRAEELLESYQKQVEN